MWELGGKPAEGETHGFHYVVNVGLRIGPHSYHEEIAEWCTAEFGPQGTRWQWGRMLHPGGANFFFRDHADAVHVRIRWT
jgi:hypothetical protein